MDSSKIIHKLTGHKLVRLTNRGNSAILHAIRLVKAYSDKEFVLIPDQGGWLSYKTFPKDAGFKIKEIKTNAGLIDVNQLDQYLDNSAALIVNQPAGYFAAQDLEAISKMCKDKVLLIADVTGSIGDKEACNGKHADILLGSFGKWKPVNLGYGGFISLKSQKLINISAKLPLIEFDKNYESELCSKLTHLNERYCHFYSIASSIKKDLNNFDIIHKDKKGINVIVRFSNNEEKQKIIDYCNLKSYPYTMCPRYIRVEENAVSIEVKRL